MSLNQPELILGFAVIHNKVDDSWKLIKVYLKQGDNSKTINDSDVGWSYSFTEQKNKHYKVPEWFCPGEIVMQNMEASLYKALMNDTEEYYIPSSNFPYQNALSLAKKLNNDGDDISEIPDELIATLGLRRPIH